MDSSELFLEIGYPLIQFLNQDFLFSIYLLKRLLFEYYLLYYPYLSNVLKCYRPLKNQDLLKEDIIKKEKEAIFAELTNLLDSAGMKTVLKQLKDLMEGCNGL